MDELDPVDSPVAYCNLCGARVLVVEILVHLRVEHDVDAEIEEWPDGEPVIIDTTLEPEDFEWAGS